MKPKIIFIFSLFWVAGIVGAVTEPSYSKGYRPLTFDKGEDQQSGEAFDKMMDVLTHPRCMNCHPSDPIPKQGDDRHPHYFGMARGENDHGFQATKCSTCHQSDNNSYSGVPGAPHWALAPVSMGWAGLSRTEIAERMLSPETNGGRSHKDLVEHLTKDELVLWAWNPGVDANGKPREIPPVSEEEFKAAVVQWFAKGGKIPYE